MKNRWLFHSSVSVALITIFWSQSADCEQVKTYEFKIKAGSLIQSLRQYSEVTSTQLLYDPQLVQNSKAPGLTGKFPQDEALALILKGSGLRSTITSSGVVLILKQDVPQVADTATTPVVVVVGVRATQRNAIEQTNRALGVVNVLTAEDVGRLPERNVADSLQRLTGASGNNDRGRSDAISIRGLGAALTIAEVNGRPIPSVWGLRSVNLDIYPSEIVSKATILKSPSADMVEGGVGGTVDLSTFKPFDVGTFSSISFSRVYTPASKHETSKDGLGARTSLIVSRVTKDKKLGILVGETVLNETIMSERFDSGVWSIADFNGDSVGGDYGLGVHDTRGQIIPAPLYISQQPAADNIRRTSQFGSIQWRPDPSLLISLDAVTSKYRTQAAYPLLAYNFFCDPNIQGATASPRSGATLFHSTSTCIDVFSGALSEKDGTSNFGLGVKWRAGDFEINGDLSISKASSTYQFPWTKAAGYFSRDVTVDWSGGGEIPKISVGNLDVSSPIGQTLSSASMAYDNKATDVLKAARVDLSRNLNFGIITRVSSGLRLENRHKRALESGRNFVLSDDAPTPINPIKFPYQSLFSDFSPQVQNKAWLYWDPWAVLSSLGNTQTVAQASSHLANSFDESEQSFSQYVRFDFDGLVFNRKTSGNFGVRFVQHSLNSDGMQEVTSGGLPVLPTTSLGIEPTQSTTATNKYSYILPSLSTRTEVRHDILLRFAFSQSIAKPEFVDLRANRDLSIVSGAGATALVGTGGNPYLKPIKVAQLDLSLEWYPDKGDRAAVTIFRKAFDSYYQIKSVNVSVPGIGIVPVTMPVRDRGAGGVVTGIELNGSYELNRLQGPFRFVTLYANATFCDIPLKINYARASGLQSYNLPLYMNRSSQNYGGFYDDGQVTLSLNYYRQGITVQNDARQAFLRLPFGVLNASAGWRLNSKIVFTLSGSNLTGEHENYADIGTAISGANTNRKVRTTGVGRSFFGTLRYAF